MPVQKPDLRGPGGLRRHGAPQPGPLPAPRHDPVADASVNGSGDGALGRSTLLEGTVAIERYATPWRVLAEQRGSAFATPEWFACWRRHYGDGKETAVAIVRDGGGELLGLLPFAVEHGGLTRTARIAGAERSDWTHPVAAAGAEGRVAKAAIAVFDREGPRWDALVLDNVDADAPWVQARPCDRHGRKLRSRGRSPSVLPYAALAGLSFDDYLEHRSASFRRQLRRFDRRLAREARLALRQTVTEAELERDLETLFRLHRARWHGRGSSSLDLPAARAFHLDFARAALERGWLRLLTLEADGEPIAAFYGWRLGDRYAFYQGGFDPAWSRLSVGLVMHGRVIERAIAEGAGEYDMLLGSEGYKFRFCESARRVETVVLTRRLSATGGIVGAELAARRAFSALPARIRDRARQGLASGARRLPTSGRG